MINNNNNYTSLSIEDKLSIGVMFILTGMSLPESLRDCFIKNNLSRYLTVRGQECKNLVL